MSAAALILPPEPLRQGDLRLLGLVGVAMVIGQFEFSILTLALPDVQTTFGVSEENAGAIIAWARLGAIPALLLALWSDHVGRRSLLIYTLLGCSVFSFATSLAQTIEWFVLFQFLARTFTSAEETIAVVFCLEAASNRNRGWSVGFLAAMGALGSGLASLAYGWVDSIPYGWRGIYAGAAIPLLYIAWLRRRLPETQLFQQKINRKDRLSIVEPIQEIMRNHLKDFVLLALISALFWFQMSAAFNLMSKYLQDTHAYAKGSVALLFIVAGAFALVANLAAGALSDHIGRRITIAVALILNVSGLLWFYNTSGSWLPIAWILALLGFFAVDVVMKAISAESFPTSCRSTAATGLTLLSVLSVAAGLFAEGYLYTLYDSHAVALSHMIPIALLALPLLWAGVRETANSSLE